MKNKFPNTVPLKLGHIFKHYTVIISPSTNLIMLVNLTIRYNVAEPQYLTRNCYNLQDKLF